MINRVNKNRSRRALPTLAPACVCGLAVSAALVGCEKKQDAPVQAPAPAPVRPKQVSADDLRMDPRVQFPQERLPTSESLAQAVASLASAIAKGDKDAMSAMLTRPAQGVLTDLAARGEWQSATSGIEAVRVVALDGGDNAMRVGLAVQDAGGAYLLAWEGREADGVWKFAGLGVAERSAARAAELDGVELTEVGAPQSTPYTAPIVATPPKREQDSSGSGSGSSPGSPGRPTIPNRPMPSLPGGGF